MRLDTQLRLQRRRVHALLVGDWDYIEKKALVSLMRWRRKEPCVYCGQPIRCLTHTLDHLIPKSHGGHIRHENAMPACPTCNSERQTEPFILYLIRRGGYGT